MSGLREKATPLARLARLGRERVFAAAEFDRALEAAAADVPRGTLLRELLLEWAGIAVDDGQALDLWDGITGTMGTLESALRAPVSLQTALLHELHTRRGLVREPRVVSLMMMDLQGFKSINDRLGHPVGDAMLVKTARVIRESLRAVDAGCRYGGDEFVAVLPNTSLVGSLAVAERIRQRVAKIQLPRRIGLQMGLHYGVATFPSDGKTLDFLVRTCDQRLYDCRRYNSDPRERRHPRFAVQGLGLRLARGLGAARQREFEIKDIGYGGLAFIYPGSRAPAHLEGELIQEFASDTFHVSMKPVSVRPLSDGRSRVGCAYDH